MFKRTMTALAAAVFATLGFAAAPANASSTNAGEVLLYQQPDREGPRELLPAAQIPTTCTSIEASFDLDSVRSADNHTTAPGTTVAFFADSTCATASEITRLAPGEYDPNIVDPNDATLGATYWMVVS